MVNLPTPKNITMWWNFGSLLGLTLTIQILTGFFLSTQYVADIEYAFSSLSRITRDVNYGWAIRTAHANGASLFFIFIYLHIGRGLYYGSFSFMGTWYTGMSMLFVLMATAFLGYVLPWGQMSYWGATVITNLFTSLPYGEDLVQWMWGGYSVGQATLSRFYSLHFIMPFLLSFVMLGHIMLLHSTGSNNPLGMSSDSEKIPFHSYFTIKDLVGFVVSLLTFFILILYAPNMLGEPDNFVVANAMITPPHIVPEWYFLFAYAILRSIPNKLGGVVGLFSAIAILSFMPLMGMKVKSCSFHPLCKFVFWLYSLMFFLLTLVGSWPVEEPLSSVSQTLSVLYFFSFFLFWPARLFTERSMYT